MNHIDYGERGETDEDRPIQGSDKVEKLLPEKIGREILPSLHIGFDGLKVRIENQNPLPDKSGSRAYPEPYTYDRGVGIIDSGAEGIN